MSGRRALPDRDPAITELDEATRLALAELWEERARSEINTGSAFARVLTGLYEVGADASVLDLAGRACVDEVRHAGLCAELAGRYRGEPPRPLEPKRVHMPTHVGAPRALIPHLHVVGLCCINESIAAAFLDACLADAAAESVRVMHREHLADDVAHARVGWAHLASRAVDDDIRRQIGAMVPRLLHANREAWRDRIATLPECGVAGHAYPPRADLLAVVDDAIDAIVRPGFDAVGVSTRR